MNKIYEDDRDILLFSFSTALSIVIVLLLFNRRKRDIHDKCLDINIERLIFLAVRIGYVILAIIFVIIAYNDLMKYKNNNDYTRIRRQEEILVSACFLLIASLINLDVLNIDTINDY